MNETHDEGCHEARNVRLRIQNMQTTINNTLRASTGYTFSLSSQISEPLRTQDGGVRLHEIVRRRRLAEVNPTILTEKILSAKNNRGETVAHLAARWWGLGYVATMLTPALLMVCDNYGDTVAHIAAAFGGLEHLGAMLTPNLIMVRNNRGATVAHVAASYNCLAELAGMLSADMLTSVDIYGNTIAHTAAWYGGLGVMTGILNTNVLMVQNKRGETPAYIAARRRELGDMLGILAPDALIFANPSRRTLLYYAVKQSILDKIPPSVWQPKWMAKKFSGRPLGVILLKDYPDYVRSLFTDFHEQIRADFFHHLFTS